MTTDESKQTASTILEQLGGNQFRAMTGARNFLSHENGELSFRIPTRSGPNYVKITLNSMDLYDIVFMKIRGNYVTTTHESNGIYCDMLRGEFERVTGLRTSLTAVYA